MVNESIMLFVDDLWIVSLYSASLQQSLSICLIVKSLNAESFSDVFARAHIIV